MMFSSAAGKRRLLLCAIIAALCSGCATVVIPPASVKDPITIYVTDYGRHSSIILPAGGTRLVEYTYGDWVLYAQNQYKWYTGWTKLLLTEHGALGRRSIEFVDNEQWLRKRVWAKRLLKIEVERDDANALLVELERIYNSRLDTQIDNPSQDTSFVQHDERYWLMHTCNQMTAGWLRKLGCQVDGAAMLSNFKVLSPGRTIVAEPAPAAPRS